MTRLTISTFLFIMMATACNKASATQPKVANVAESNLPAEDAQRQRAQHPGDQQPGERGQ